MTQPQSKSVSLRRIFVALMVIFFVFGVLFAERKEIREHKLYFTEDRKNVVFQLSELSEAWSENTLRERFKDIPLNCFLNPGNDLGDLVCILDTKSFNGVPALLFPFSFRRVAFTKFR